MRLPAMTCLRLLPHPLTSRCLLSHRQGQGEMGKPWSRNVGQRALTVTAGAHSARPLASRPRPVASRPRPLWSTLSPEVQSCRALSSARPGWYESVADSAPVHLTEQFLVSAQQVTGLPWWACIACTTLALRSTFTLPLAVYQSVIIAKVEALQKEIAEIAKQLSYEISVRAKEKRWSEQTCRYQFKKNLRRIVSELYVRDNCHPFKASVLVWVQLPMWVGVSFALRNLSVGLEHVPGGVKEQLAAGGALWFPDLTLPDSTWIIPVSLGLVNLLITEIFALRQLEPSKFQKYMTNFVRGLSVVMVPLAATVPSAMAWYWLCSSCVGLGHNLLLRSPRFRTLLRVPPLRSDSDTPYRDIAAAFRTKYLK
ncbi:cytochrome c oxidase assembly protein COX18, mitochondrial [Brachyhypopomus gauderio]|uniref:cytochrome c oxidase assembly protein COX18, mitochondrial n=1 Tax=Brachyhypopomus gauderio TaxID=698409 RepID=UPI0040411B19